MIAVNELRIGNFLLENPKLKNPNITLPSVVIVVSEILHNRISYNFPNLEHRVEAFEDDRLQTEPHYKNVNEVEPIPLTTEILETCGFDKSHDTGIVIWKMKGFLITQQADKNNYWIIICDKRVSVKYLHEIQNVYFYCEREELNVQL